LHGLGLHIAVAAVFGTAALAEEVVFDRVATFGQWGVFAEHGPLECWATAWSEREFGPDGRQISNGDSQIFVMFRPFEERFAEVQFYANGRTLLDGYPGSIVTQDVVAEMGIQGEWAWPMTTDDDLRLVVAMADAPTVQVNVALANGQVMSAEFDLDGFAAAVTDAQARCAVLAAG
jgi:hypothetical protein